MHTILLQYTYNVVGQIVQTVCQLSMLLIPYAFVVCPQPLGYGCTYQTNTSRYVRGLC